MSSSVRPIYLDFWVTYEAFRDDLPMKIINIYQFLSQLSKNFLGRYYVALGDRVMCQSFLNFSHI